jgi:hypothetical protein
MGLFGNIGKSVGENIGLHSLTTEAEELKASLEWKGKGALFGEQREKAKQRYFHIMKILREYERRGKITGIKYLELKKVV